MSVFVGRTRPKSPPATSGGAPGDLSAMTNDELRALCAARGVEVPARANKRLLLEALGRSA